MQAVAAEHVITGTGEVLAPGWVAFRDGVVSEVAGGVPPRGPGVVRGGAGSVVIPGLVCAHAHLALGELGSVADDAPFLAWIHEGILPAVEDMLARPEGFGAGALASAHELLSGGVTLVGDSFLRSDGVDACRRTGLKGVFFQEVFGSLADDEAAYVEQTMSELDRLAEELDGFPFGYAPHTPWTCPERTLRAVTSRARREGRRMAIHLDESREEHEFFLERSGPLHEAFERRGMLDRYRFGLTPTAYLEEVGALGPDVLAAHAVQVTAGDVEILRRTGTHVVHCPVSNMKLAEGIAPVAAMLEAGVPVSLGTDSSASTGRLDMFEQMRVALLCQRGATRAVGPMTADNVLRMATSAGAEALGMGERTGTLQRGKAADLALLDLSAAGARALREPAAAVVYHGTPEAVRLVVVDGVERYRRA